jgi:hypothetical protein
MGVLLSIKAFVISGIYFLMDCVKELQTFDRSGTVAGCSTPKDEKLRELQTAWVAETTNRMRKAESKHTTKKRAEEQRRHEIPVRMNINKIAGMSLLQRLSRSLGSSMIKGFLRSPSGATANGLNLKAVM